MAGIYTLDDLRQAAKSAGVDGTDAELIQEYSKRTGMAPEQVAGQLGVVKGGKWANRGGAAIDSAQASLYGVAEAAGLGDWAMRGRKRNAAEADLSRSYAREQGAIMSTDDIKGVGDIPEYVGGLAIDTAPQMASILAGGAAGGPAGALGAAYTFALGDVLDNQREQSGKTDLLSAGLLAAPYAAVDAMSGVGGKLASRSLGRSGLKLLDEVPGLKGAALRTGASVGRTAITEGAGETFQEGMNQLGRMAVDPNETFLNDRSIKNFKESAIGGAALGGAFGAVGGHRRSEGYQAPTVPQAEQTSESPPAGLRLGFNPIAGDPPTVFPDGTTALASDVGEYRAQLASGSHPGRSASPSDIGAAQTTPLGDVSPPVAETQSTTAVQEALQGHAEALEAQRAAAQPPQLSPEEQVAQDRIEGIKAKAAETAQAIKARDERAKSAGLKGTAAFDVYGRLEDALSSGLIDDAQFGENLGLLQANRRGQVDKYLKAIVETKQAPVKTDADEIAAAYGKLQPQGQTANVPSTAQPGTQASATPGTAIAPQGTVAGIDAGKKVTVGRAGREVQVTPTQLLQKITAASPLDKLRIMAVTGMEVTTDPTTGAPRLVNTGSPMSFEQVAVEEATQTGKKVTRQAIAQALKKYGIDENVVTQMTAQAAPDAVTTEELGINPEQNGSGFRVESELSKTTGQGLVDDGNTPTKKQRELTEQGTAILKEAGATTEDGTAVALPTGAKVTDLREQNPEVIEANIKAILESPEASNAAADWGSEKVAWDDLPDTLKADWIGAYYARLEASEGQLTQRDFRLLDTEQVNIENDYADYTKHSGGQDSAATVPGLPAKDEGTPRLAGPEAGAGTDAATAGTGSYVGDAGSRVGDAPKPVVKVKKTRKVVKPSIEQGKGGSTVARVLTEIAKLRLGLDPRKVTVVQSLTDLPPFIQKSVEDANPQAFVLGGRAFLIADNIKPGNARAVFLHEVGSHMGLENLLTAKEFSRLAGKLTEWADRNDGSLESRLARLAIGRVGAAQTEDAQVQFEQVAYFIEEAVKAGIDPTAIKYKSELGRWMSELIRTLKAGLAKLGVVNAEGLTAQDIVDMAYGAAQLELQSDQRVEGGGTKYSYAGERAQNSNKDALQAAKEFIEAGAKPDDVRQATGWFKGKYDDKWRFEINDTDAKWTKDFKDIPETPLFGKGPDLTIGDVLSHDKLFEAYPELRDAKFVKRPGFLDFGGLQGSFNPETMTLQVTPYAQDPLSTAIHEIQHWIQTKEGFEPGGNESTAMEAMTPEQMEKLGQQIIKDQTEAISKAAESAEILARVAHLPELKTLWEANAEFVKAANEYKEAGHPERLKAYQVMSAAEKAFMRAAFGHDNYFKLSDEERAVYTRSKNKDRFESAGDEVVKAIADGTQKIADVRSGDLDRLKGVLKSSSTAFSAYQRIAGEIEARDVQARQTMSDEQRNRTAPYSSEGIDPKDAIRIGSKVGSASSKIAYSIDTDMPAPVRKAHSVIGSVMSDVANKATLLGAFTKDLARMASKVLPSAQRYVDLVDAAAVAKTRSERNVESILDRYDSLPAHERGTGPASVNSFLHDATMKKAWAYKPEYHSDVAVDTEMKARFDRMSASAQDLIKAVFKHGHDNLQQLKTAVVENISTEHDALIKEYEAAGDTKAAEATKKAKAKSLKDYQSLLDLQGNWPYAPLKRFGNQVVVGMSKAYLDAKKAGDNSLMRKLQEQGGHYHVEFAETKREAQARAEELRAAGAFAEGGMVQDFEKDDVQDTLYGGRDTLNAFRRLRTLVSESQDEGLSANTNRALNALMNDLHLTLLGEASARQSERNRKNIAGADKDMMRAFASQGRATAHFIASLKNNGRIQDELLAMKQEADAMTEGRRERRDYYNELLRRHVMGMEYNPSPLVEKAMAGTSLWMLLTSPAHFLTNATQPFVMSLPVLAGRHGYARSFAAMSKAYREVLPLLKDGKFDEADYDKLPADVRQGIEQLANKGFIDISLDQDLGRWRSAEDSKMRHVTAVTEKLRGFAQTVESANRLVTAIAALRLEAQANPSQEGQVAYAGRVIYDTHGDYSGFNSPRLMRSGIGRLATQFRKFQLIQLSMYARLLHTAFKGASPEERAVARTALTYSLGHMFVLGGLLGMPGAQAIGWLLRQVFGDDDEPDNPELTLRKMIGNETMADLLIKGAPKMLGVDLSGRLGAGGMLSLLPYTDTSLDRKGYENVVMGALGPFMGGLLPRFADGAGQIGKGDVYKGLEQFMPKGLSDAMKGFRLAGEGMTQRNGDLVMSHDEISFLDGLMQAAGLPTNTLTDRSFRSNAKFKADQFFKEKTADVKKAFTKAYRSGDSAAMAEARQAWQDLQAARMRNGYQRRPLSDLLKSPREQHERERNTSGGVQYRRGDRRSAQQLDELA